MVCWDDAEVRWSVLTWLAVAIALAAAACLAVDIAVAGPGQAAGLAGVIAGFCELAALVLGVAAWAARRQATDNHSGRSASRVAEKDGETAPTAREGADKYVVDSRQARGIQVGDGNTQHNDFRS
jgi:hypothetical protein